MTSKPSSNTKVRPINDDLELRRTSNLAEGIIESKDENVNREFYGTSISDAYRMKSELLARHMAEIGMGK